MDAWSFTTAMLERVALKEAMLLVSRLAHSQVLMRMRLLCSPGIQDSTTTAVPSAADTMLRQAMDKQSSTRDVVRGIASDCLPTPVHGPGYRLLHTVAGALADAHMMQIRR